MFSERTEWDVSRNPLTEAWDLRRRSGLTCIDLTQSNPTTCGLAYPPRLLDAISSPPGLFYQPEARGLPSAIEAVARHISTVHKPTLPRAPGSTADSSQDHGDACGPARVDPASIILSAGTSEAYSWLFKLLCNHGDEVMIPRPSYPLLEYLADLECVSLRPYTLHYDGRWNLDRQALEDALTPRTRAVVAVHPNNPTGNLMTRREAAMLAQFCAEHDLALISDEVFLEYPLQERTAPPATGAHAGSLAPESPCLAFSLGGLSKSCGLPQLKLGWIQAGGPHSLREEAIARLEIIADTFLSVNTPAQVALPEILQLAMPVRDQIRRRTAGNWRHLATRAAGSAGAPWSLLDADAGWSAILRIPATRSEERWCLDILERHGILLHPGYFFDLPGGAFIVASLLPQESVFREAIDRVLEFLERGV